MTHDSLAALNNGAIICPVTSSGLLRFSGEDSQAFLHGQLSSDVKSLDEGHAQYSSYSSPKGRLFATFLIFRQEGDYWLQLASELTPSLQKRLSMFILRSKTRCTDASAERVLFGIAGPEAAKLIETITGSTPTEAFGVKHLIDYSVVALSKQRFLLISRPEKAAALQQQCLTAGAVAAPAEVWQLTDIRAGIPWVGAATQEEFVLQMVNLDLIGGVSFTKGCYPGQEIVARTRYIGKVKRRMYHARLTAKSVTAGQDVFSPEMNGQSSGKVLQAAPLDHDQWECLVVTQMSSLEHGLRLGELNGPPLEILELPYPIE